MCRIVASIFDQLPHAPNFYDLTVFQAIEITDRKIDLIVPVGHTVQTTLDTHHVSVPGNAIDIEFIGSKPFEYASIVRLKSIEAVGKLWFGMLNKIFVDPFRRRIQVPGVEDAFNDLQNDGLAPVRTGCPGLL